MAKSLWSPGRRADERTYRSIDRWLTRLKVVNWKPVLLRTLGETCFFSHTGFRPKSLSEM